MLRAFSTIGPRETARIAAHRAWSCHASLGLRVELDQLPPRREARVSTCMRPVEAGRFEGFAAALPTADENEKTELLQRTLLCEGHVDTLFVAHAGDAPIYAQWLVDAGGQEALHQVTGGLYPRLLRGEALVEGAYTFRDFRGLSAMADGMWQLLAQARSAGATSVYTYVSPDNIPSLRGCARVGFELDHVRVERRRAGRTLISRVAPDQTAAAAWSTAIA